MGSGHVVEQQQEEEQDAAQGCGPEGLPHFQTSVTLAHVQVHPHARVQTHPKEGHHDHCLPKILVGGDVDLHPKPPGLHHGFAEREQHCPSHG
jgi:hypothetical protein